MNSNIRFRALRIFFDFVFEWINFFPFFNHYISKDINRKIDFFYPFQDMWNNWGLGLEWGLGLGVFISSTRNNTSSESYKKKSGYP